MVFYLNGVPHSQTLGSLHVFPVCSKVQQACLHCNIMTVTDNPGKDNLTINRRCLGMEAASLKTIGENPLVGVAVVEMQDPSKPTCHFQTL